MKVFTTKYNNVKIDSPTGEISLTDQQFKDECDINSILKRYKVGQVPTNIREGRFGDFSDVADFQTNLERLNKAKDDFANLSAEVRARFGNDMQSFYQFILNPENVNECIKLGLMEEVKPERTALDAIDELKEVVTAKRTSSSTQETGNA